MKEEEKEYQISFNRWLIDQRVLAPGLRAWRAKEIGGVSVL